MSTRFDELMDTINRRAEARRASDRAVARMTGQTIAAFDADTTAPDLPRHKRRVNLAGRQICCLTCHKCGHELRNVLDGEQWCPNCGAYR